MNRAALLALINANFPDNSTRLITAARARTVLSAMVAHLFVLAEDAVAARSVKEAVVQAAHGLAAGMAVRQNAQGAYVPALADNAANAEVYGLVESVADANTFTLVTYGAFEVPGRTYLAGTAYFLSPQAAGAATSVPPSADGQVFKCIVLGAGGPKGYFVNFTGEILSEASEGVPGGGPGTVDITALLATRADYDGAVAGRLIHTLLLAELLALKVDKAAKAAAADYTAGTPDKWADAAGVKARLDALEARLLGGAAPAYDTLLELYNYINSTDGTNDAALAALVSDVVRKSEKADAAALAAGTPDKWVDAAALAGIQGDLADMRQGRRANVLLNWAGSTGTITLPATGTPVRVIVPQHNPPPSSTGQNVPLTEIANAQKGTVYWIDNARFSIHNIFAFSSFMIPAGKIAVVWRNNNDTGTLWEMMALLDTASQFSILNDSVPGTVTATLNGLSGDVFVQASAGFSIDLSAWDNRAEPREGRIWVRKNVNAGQAAQPITLPAGGNNFITPDSLPMNIPSADANGTLYLLSLRVFFLVNVGTRRIFKLERLTNAA